jgi:hypothetical protein
MLARSSTAKWPGVTADGVKSRWLGDCDFNVVAFVDAQNGFGAQIRSSYEALVTYVPERDSWKLNEIKVE